MDILEGLEDCKRCREIDIENVSPVMGTGSIEASICILGRNPGKQENLEHRPFVGRAGRKLFAILHLQNIEREHTYVTNVVKCATIDTMPPSRFCLLNCSRTWLDLELSLLTNLSLVIVLGNQALKYFEPYGTVSQLHGTIFTSSPAWCSQQLTLFVSYHPSAALRSRKINAQFYKDFQQLKEIVHDGRFISATGL